MMMDGENFKGEKGTGCKIDGCEEYVDAYLHGWRLGSFFVIPPEYL